MALFNEKEMKKQPVPEKPLAVQSKEIERTAIIDPAKKVIRFNEKQLADKKQVKKKKLNGTQKKEEKKRSREKAAVKKEEKKKRAKAKKSIVDVLPVIDMTNIGLIELKEEHGFFDICQIQSKDVYAMNEEETKFDIYNFAQFLQAFQHPVKIVALNFPVSTVKQQEFIQKKIEECKSSLYEKFLLRKLKELQYLEWGRTNREYVMFIFGSSEKEVVDRVKSVTRLLQRSAPLSLIDEEKKTEILYKLLNQNSKLGSKKQ
jgi:hypothetical protein